MDDKKLFRIAARVAAGESPVHVEVVHLEGGGYTEEDLAEALKSGFSPVWASMTEYGWVFLDRDPSELSDSTPIEPEDFGATTWGELQEHLGDDPLTFQKYASSADFATNEELLLILCSYDEASRAPMVSALKGAGFDAAADKLSALQF